MPRPEVLMLDVDGVLVNGRPEDGKHLFTDIEADLGISLSLLQASFFDPYWQQIVVGKDALKPRLSAVLGKIAPQVDAQRLIDYWLASDSRIDAAMLAEVNALRHDGTKVFLATNQEHLRARYLMENLGLGAHVDGIIYSAALGLSQTDARILPAGGGAGGSIAPRDRAGRRRAGQYRSSASSKLERHSVDG